MKNRILSAKIFFIAAAVLSLIVLLTMLFPEGLSVLGPNILFLWVLLGLCGAGLVFATFREKIAGKAKLFLLLTGFSSAGFLLGVVLHNLFYALAILAEDIQLLVGVLNVLEAAFFILAVIVCPLGLIVGLVGTLWHWQELP